MFVLQLVVISQYHLGKILDLSGHMETSQLDDSVASATQEVFTDDLATVYVSNVSTSFAQQRRPGSNGHTMIEWWCHLMAQ